METIRIGVAHRGAGLAPVFAAIECGALHRAGLRAELVDTPGHPAALAALLAGEVDVVNTVGPELLRANHRHRGDAVVVASAISRTAVQIAARPGIATRDALRGGRFACVEPGDPDCCSVWVACAVWGWDFARDATMVPVGTRSLGRLLDAKRVDAAILHAPEPFQAPRHGWHVVEDTARHDVPFQNSCAATTRRMLAARPDAVRRYVRAYLEGVWRFRTDAAFGMAVLRAMTAETDDVLEASWLLFARAMTGMGFPSLSGLREAARALRALGVLPEGVDGQAALEMGVVAGLEADGQFAAIMRPG
ncbi:ABC transporter substrate-binding protein [Leptolyngbya sp. 15MV]|nr:ABC transporter substrate-binding protein [Leptolyngbya sp. 15MV]